MREGNLILERRVGQRILIGDDVTIEVIEVTKGGKVKLSIKAPRSLPVDRAERVEIVLENEGYIS